MTEQQTAAQDARIAELEAELEAVGAGGASLMRNDDAKDAARWRAWAASVTSDNAVFFEAFATAVVGKRQSTVAEFNQSMDAAMAATKGM